MCIVNKKIYVPNAVVTTITPSTLKTVAFFQQKQTKVIYIWDGVRTREISL